MIKLIRFINILFYLIFMVVKRIAKFKEIKNLTPTVKEFDLELEEDFDFKAGQFVNISFREGETLYRKPYSIASKPDGTSNISLCIKLVKDGKTTPVLFEKKEGFEVEVMGPLGLFTLEKSSKDNLLFIGTGTGVAPLKSMIEDELSRDNEKQLTLILGVRYENELLYKKEFEKLEEENPNFKFIQVVSRPTEEWEGRRGHVQDNFDSIDVLNSEAYICGLPIMVEEVMKKLQELGIDEDCIHHEKYV